MSSNKILNRINYSILFWSVFCALIPSYALSQLGLFEDLGIYYYFFEQVGQVGLVDAFCIFYESTGKVEPILFSIFYIQSFIIPNDEFFFLLMNFSILNFGFSKLILKLVRYDGNYYSYMIIVSILSYSYFSREIYILRSMYAFLFFLMLVNSEKYRNKFFIILLGTLTHISFSIFAILFLLIKFLRNKLSRGSLFIILGSGVFVIQLIIVSSSFLSSLTASGDIEVFISANATHSIQSMILVIFTLFAILSIIRPGLSENEASVLLMCLVLIIISMLNYSSYHLMNRVAAPALCIMPFMVMLKKNNRWSVIIKGGYIFSIFLTLRLIYLFASGNFAIPE